MKHTPLYNEHLKLKARMVEFGGWEMPVIYAGVIAEHLAVREAAGIFDVSHMGEFEFKGPDALSFIQYLTTNDISKIADGQAVYSLLCSEQGTIVDDIIVCRFNPEHILIVVNASNIDKDWDWVTSHKKGNVAITNRSDDFGLIALQGPKAAQILQKCAGAADIPAVKPFYLAKSAVCGIEGCILARTGYTGEDGFEIFCPSKDTPKIWQALIENGAPLGLKPAGLGARDTLRLEMKYSLYGHEINDKTNPLEASLGWVVKLNKETDFIGKSAIEKVKAEGIKRKCVGFQMIDPGIPREGYGIFPTHQRTNEPSGQIGFVCSGTMSPSLQKAIGTGYVPTEDSKTGSKIYIDIRGNKRLAEVVETPFLKK
ncbi:MAG: glycine cleavage system aminomethyltransferase GcvT [Deltaproteobacteria bacterium]|nr:glycine cleavage system aminomethyltransferase GcvT [Deltaproteobacteria bacterium]